MLNPQRVAEVLSRGLAKSGMSAEELATKVGMKSKRLQRWLHKGITRTREDEADHLRQVCEHLKVDVWERPQSEQVRQFSELLETVEKNKAVEEIRPLLNAVKRAAVAATVAQRMATEHPDLVPEEFANELPFRSYFLLASELMEGDPGRYGDRSDSLFDQLHRRLWGRRALQDGKIPARWAVANQFHADKKYWTEWKRDPRAAKYPRAIARLRHGNHLETLVEQVNGLGDVQMKFKSEREAIFWERVASLELACEPFSVTREMLQIYAKEYPHAVARLTVGNKLEETLEELNAAADQEGKYTAERWDDFRKRLAWMNTWGPIKPTTPPSSQETPLASSPSGTEPKLELSPEKQEALNETLAQAARPERQVTVSRGLGSKLRSLKSNEASTEPPTDGETSSPEQNG